MNSKIKVLILLILGVAGNAFAVSSSLSGVYYDYNKGSSSGIEIGNGTTNIDGNLCWAAAAANGIQWWQTRVENGGFKNISSSIFENLKNDSGLSVVNYSTNLGNPQGYTIVSPTQVNYTSAYSDSIWGTFVASWTDGGGFSDNAYRWWFDGSNASTGDARLLPGVTAGGYIKNVSWQSTDIVGKSSVVSNNSLTFKIKEWNNFSGLRGLNSLYNTINQAVKDGIVMSIGIYQNGQNGHAMTAYGCRIENGKFYLTVVDSDDGALGTKEVELGYANKKFYFVGTEYAGYTLDYMTGFSAVVKKTFTSNLAGRSIDSNEDLHTTNVDGVFYFGRDPNVQLESGEYTTSVLWSDGNMIFEGDSSIWIDIDMDYSYDTIECAGAFAKSDSWVDGDKLNIDIADFSDLGDYAEELIGLSIMLAAFESTDFVLSDFVLSSDIDGYLSIGELDGINGLYLTFVPEPASYAAFIGVIALALALRRRIRG